MRPIFGIIFVFLLLWCPGCQGFFLPDWFINWLGYSRPRPIPAAAILPDLRGRISQTLEENANTTISSKEQEPSGVEVYTNSAGIFSRPDDDGAEKDSKKSWRPSRPLNIFDPSFNPFHTQNSYTPVLMPFKHSFFPGLVVQGGYPFVKPKPCYLNYNYHHHDSQDKVNVSTNATKDRVDKQQDPILAADPSIVETTTTKAVDPVAFSASNYANVESAKEDEVTKVEPTTDPIWEAIKEVMYATSPPKSYFSPPVDRDDKRPTKLSDLRAPSSATIIRVENGQNQGEAMVLSAMLLNSQNNQYSAPDIQSYLPIKSPPSTNPPTLTTSPRSTTAAENVTQDHPIYSIPLSHNHTVLGSSRGFRPVNQYPPFQRVWKPAIYPISVPTSPFPINLPVSLVGRQEDTTNNRGFVENVTMSGIRFEGGFRPMRLMRRKPFNVNTFAIKV